MVQAYQGYFREGRFVSPEPVAIPENVEVYVMVTGKKMPRRKPVAFGTLSEAEFNAEMEKGFADMEAGRIRPAADVFADLRQDYGI